MTVRRLLRKFLALPVSLALFATLSAAPAYAVEVISVDAPPPDPGRHGFYLRFEPKAGALVLWSRASVLSDFQQRIGSSASATGWGWDFQIGGRILDGVALAAVFEEGSYQNVRVGIRDESVGAHDLQLETFSFGLLTTITPFADRGWHGSFSLRMCSIDTTRATGFRGETLNGPLLRGGCTSLAAGYEMRLSEAWWAGAGARFAYLFMLDPSHAATHALEPGLVLTVTYY